MCFSPLSLSHFPLGHLKVLWDSPFIFLYSKMFVLGKLFKALPTSLRVPVPCDHLHRKTTYAHCTLRPLDLNIRDWSSTWSQVIPRSPDHMCFRCMPSLLISIWKTMGTIIKSMNQQTSHKTLERSSVAYLLPVFVPALKYGPPVWVYMPALNMYAQTTLY